MPDLPKMEVKTILDKFRHQEVKKETFFALEISRETVKTAIWLVEDQRVSLLTFGETCKWQGDDLLSAVDASIFSAVANVKSEQIIEPDKVILGLPPDWVEQDKIIPDKGEILKNIVKSLGLVPIGFVVTPEAMIHQLKAVEGLPPTAVLVSLESQEIIVTLVDLGKVKSCQIVRRSDNLGADVAEGLSRSGETGPFPSRVLLSDGPDISEKARQELINYSWTDAKINFLHLPKIEILGPNFDIESVALAGGSEFVEPAHLSEEPAKQEEPAEEQEELAAPAEPVMGFVEGKDVTSDNLVPPSFQTAPARHRPKVWSKFKNFHLPKVTIPGFLKAKALLIVVLFFIFCSVGLAAAYWYLPRAEVSLSLRPKILEESLEIKLDSSLETVDASSLSIPAGIVEATLDGEKIAPTTGTKIVGDPAKGEVTIYNGTAYQKVFSAGTVIMSSSGLKFNLDEQVSVASQSGTAASPVPGRATVKVTADKIGADGNLAAETEFSIGSFGRSDYIAKNPNAFGGGVSRDVQVVAKVDQENLASSLSKELESGARDELNSRLEEDQKLIKESLERKVISKNFDKEVGEEATQVGLKMQLDFEALAYRQKDLLALVMARINESVPEGFVSQLPDQVDFETKEVTDKKVISGKVSFKENYKPEVDLEKIRQDLVGKRVDQGESYLRTLNNIASFQAKISPKFPRQIARFPRLIKKIIIKAE